MILKIIISLNNVNSLINLLMDKVPNVHVINHISIFQGYEYPN